MSVVDPYWSSVVLNLRMEGANNGTVFTDDKGKTVTPSGNAKTSTADFKYGRSSAYSDGTGGYLTSPVDTGASFGTDDFTVEAWVNIPAYSNMAIFDTLPIGGSGSRSNSIVFIINNSGYLTSFHAGGFRSTSTNQISLNTWIHIAFVRSGNNLTYYINGVDNGSVSIAGLNDSLGGLVIGTVSDSVGAYNFNGYIDELRITKGIARYTAKGIAQYTATFTPSEIWDGVTVGGGGGNPTVLQDLDIKVLPYTPSVNIRETYSWVTSHIPTWTAEERTQLRERPSFKADYKVSILSEAVLDILVQFYEDHNLDQVRVPMWSSPTRVLNLTLAATFIPLASSHPLRAFLQVGGEIILWVSPLKFEVCSIQSLSPSGLTLAAPLLNSFPACYLLPCLTGTISAPSVTKTSGSRKAWNFTFTCSSVYLEEYPFLSSSSLFDERPLISTEFSTIRQREVEVLSTPLGNYEKLQTEGVTRQAWGVSFTAHGLADSVTLKRKLAFFRGKAKALRFNFQNLISGSHSKAVNLTEDSVSFSHHLREACSTSVGFIQSLTNSSVPFSRGVSGDYYLLTVYDWDASLFGGNAVMEDPGYPVDGHVTYIQPISGVYKVVESTGNYATLPGCRVGDFTTTLPNLGTLHTSPIGQTGLFHVYS